jgi:hypothetical protein
MYYYDYAQQVSAAAGFCASRFFIANGLFDPDISGSGHQPMGFDQMMGVYTTYTVLRSSITITCTAEVNGAILGIYLSPDTTAITDPIRLVENGQMRVVHLSQATNTGANRQASITFSCDVAKYFGRRGRRALLNDDNLSGTAAANPFEGVYFGVVTWCFYSSNSAVVDYDVLLTYDAIFTEPRKLTVS